MKTTVLENSDLHFEHRQWRAELSLWEDELKSFKNRLGELITRWTNKDVLAQLEQFQNHFHIHAEEIDTLQHDINVHETDMAEHSKKGEDVINRIYAKQHMEFRDRIETERKLYNELKQSFFRFLTKYM